MDSRVDAAAHASKSHLAASTPTPHHHGHHQDVCCRSRSCQSILYSLCSWYRRQFLTRSTNPAVRGCDSRLSLHQSQKIQWPGKPQCHRNFDSLRCRNARRRSLSGSKERALRSTCAPPSSPSLPVPALPHPHSYYLRAVLKRCARFVVCLDYTYL